MTNTSPGRSRTLPDSHAGFWVHVMLWAGALLSGNALLSGCAAGHPYTPGDTLLSEDPVLLPTRMWGGYFLVDAELEGQGYTFMLDTGADCMLVSPAIARRLSHLVRATRSTVRSANGDVAEVSQVLQVESLHVGPVELRDFAALVMEVGQLSDALGTHIDGVVGLPLFADCLLTLDYPSQLAWLARGELDPVDRREVLALNPDGVGEIDAPLGDRTVTFKIDSGFSREIGLPIPGNRDFLYGPRTGSEIVTITGTHRQQEGVLADTLRLGHHTFYFPRVAINGGDPKLGSSILRHFAVTFDQQNHRVQFASPSGRPLAAGRRRSRWATRGR